MESNTTLLNDGLNNHSNGTIPLYLTYLKLFGLLFGALFVTIPALIMIAVIVKNRKRRNINNIKYIFFTNLLIADVGFADTLEYRQCNDNPLSF